MILTALPFNLISRRESLNVKEKVVLAFAIACLTGLLAQVRFNLFWTPIAITGQTFAVFLSAIILGKWWGGASQFIYACLGFMGVPWFSGLSGGIAFVFSPSVGYIIGFIFASLFLGYFFEKYREISFANALVLMFFANIVFIYGAGIIALYFFRIASSFSSLLAIGVMPFLAGDIVKIFTAAAIAKAAAKNNF
ncbi:MAG: biotin transporter BioY [Candidatus Pacebacteria bacterium]|nr:biotin transporter BioY [Candidatus Paceibacterota bacterium]